MNRVNRIGGGYRPTNGEETRTNKNRNENRIPGEKETEGAWKTTQKTKKHET